MTREEAIRWLEDIHRRFNPTGENLENEGGDVHLQALDMAIEALTNVQNMHKGEWIGYNADKEDWLRTDGTPIFLVCDKCHGTVINNGSAHWNFCVGAMYDEELNEMMKDLVKVLHDVEWWQSSDIGEDSYRKTVKEFKDKWFNSDRSERLKPIIDRRINEVRTELINMIGGDTE